MSIGPWQLLLIAIVVLLLFGNRLPKIMGDFGKGIRNLKKGLQDEEEGKETKKPDSPKQLANKQHAEVLPPEEKDKTSEDRR